MTRLSQQTYVLKLLISCTHSLSFYVSSFLLSILL